jgi:aryl-alcohol dehydrogenase-like predicted oxidoreductase
MTKLGNTGLEVSSIGFGCMSITAFYGEAMDDESAVALLRGAYDAGYRHFDTAEVYATKEKHNEKQLGAFLRTVPRDSFTVATKFMPSAHKDKCDLQTVQGAVDVSLERLGLNSIDLYYCHRMPPDLEKAKEWMLSMKEIVASRKVKHVGLSEVGPTWLPIMHAIHPVACVQQEWSLFTRNLENTMIPIYRELGIGVVAYSPLARNLLTNPTQVPTDWRAANPRYSGENFKHNQSLVKKISLMASERKLSAAQLSLAWLYCKAKELGVSMVPIPGTTKLKNASDNAGAIGIDLSQNEMRELEKLGTSVAGDRAQQDYLNRSLEGQSKL